jgi:hypothetical protein
MAHDICGGITGYQEAKYIPAPCAIWLEVFFPES